MTLTYDSLPPSEPIVRTNRVPLLKDTITNLFGEHEVAEYTAPVEGAPCSCRVYLLGPYEGIQRDTPRDSEDIAYELRKFIFDLPPEGAEYPSEQPETKNHKGWEIRAFMKDGEILGIIATAVWV